MTLLLAGLDVGTTTTSLMAASANFVRNCVTGRNELGNVVPFFRPESVFTPFRGELLDVDAVESQLEQWFAAAGLEFGAVTGGGALVTGLAARSANSTALTQLVKKRFQNAVVACTDDPCLESWLAFMGNSLGLSRAEPKRAILNLDIGGGTTNVAWGLAGEVLRCGCYYVGARHVQVEPGTYRVKSLSSFASSLFAELGIAAGVGADLARADVEAVLEFYVELLESVVAGREFSRHHELAKLHCQTDFIRPVDDGRAAPDAEPIITLSGGVGELAYRHARGEPLPGTTAFGDLGIELARRICQSPILGKNLKTHVPVGLGRATVQGLTIHSTEISGSTLYLPHPGILPLVDLPILGAIGSAKGNEDFAALFELAARSGRGACLRVQLEIEDRVTIKALGERLARLLAKLAIPPNRPLVLLASGNFGKTLGQYATRWGQVNTSLAVIDEVPNRSAHFVTIGKPQNGLIPVAFHGLESRMDDHPVP
jgi:ethanolamine utilization protein EutA